MQPNGNTPPDGEDIQLLTPGEVAALYRVDIKTVSRWALDGKFGSIKTPGGHRRYFAREIFAALGASATRQVQP